jgi:hypothetical protein
MCKEILIGNSSVKTVLGRNVQMNWFRIVSVVSVLVLAVLGTGFCYLCVVTWSSGKCFSFITFV